MPTVAEHHERYAASFEALRRGPAAGPPWLRAVRQAAFDRFSAAGFPTTRDEEWRFTSVAPIAETTFEVAPAARIDRAAIAPFVFSSETAAEVLLVNGRVASISDVPAGVTMTSLAAEFAGVDGTERAPIGVLAKATMPFVELNTAFFEDGVVIRVAPGAVVERPIHVLHVAVGEASPIMASPRVFVLVGEHADVRLIESYASIGGGRTFTNAVTELAVQAGAVVDHCKIQREQPSACHVAAMFVSSGRGATTTSHSIVLGGRLVRNDIVSVLAGEGAETTLNGLYVADGDALVDNHTLIDHAEPHCPSHEVYRGILAGRAKAVFNGKIIVRQIAQKTDAKQTNKALLLSDDATINTKPQLEIFADDVKCTHGAAIGQLDEDALFYLRARGIDAVGARNMLIHAFAGDIVGRIREDDVRERVLAALDEKLALA